MYNFVIFLLYFTILGLFTVCWFALRKGNSRIHSYLLFSCIANLVYNTGYLMQLHATNQENYVVALKLGYLGRIWIGYALVLFIAELCDFYIPGILRTIAALIHIIIYFTILNLERTNLYYNYMEFVMVGDFPKLIHTGGVLYYLLTAMNLTYVVSGMVIITRAFIKEKNGIAKKRYLMMVIAIFFVGSTYVIYFFKLVPLARIFDVMIIGYAICIIFMLIGIIKYKMLDATAAAKNFVVDELSEAVVVVNSEGKISYSNNQAKKIFPELVPDKKAKDSLVERFDEMAGGGEPIRMGEKVYTPKADRVIMDGKDVGTLYSFSDDTEHYRYMDELKVQKQAADDANKAKSQFLANMSHEIRTPINAVLGFNEMIISECNDAGKKIEETEGSVKDSFDNIGRYAGNIQSAGGNLLSIINDILDFSKIEAGKMELVQSDYRLNALLNDVSNMISFKAKEKGLDFSADIDESLPNRLHGDRVRIRQIITNILSNAVKYTDAGYVKMTVRGKKDEREGFGNMIRLVIDIRDTGIGIKEEDIDRLFSKFQRLEMEKNSTVEGTGLGLAISEQLLSMMDGSIKVESIYGEGSVFTIEIPQRIVSSEPIGDLKTGFEKDVNGENINKALFNAPDARVLIVDDTKMNITVAKGLLKKTQMQVDTARSGEEALALTKEKAFDIILMDQRMPNMDGTEALKRIRSQEGGENIETPVICMTADAIIGAKERYLSEGFNDYLSKPIDSNELLTKIKKYLPEGKIAGSE